MTRARAAVLWLEGREPPPTRLDGPVAWLMPHVEADRAALPPPTREDREDAAAAKREGGAPRLIRRRMLRALLASLFDLHPDTVRLTRDPAGAPFGLGLDACVSTAGCDRWSVVAVARTPLGVDVERVIDGEAETIRRWTLVEAYLKSLGQGLHIAPEAVRVERGAGAAALSLAGADPKPARGWTHAAAPDVIAAVVLRD